MKKTFSVLLSLFVLFSSFSYSVSAHYCGQTLIDIALFGDADSCPMSSEMDCDSQKPCCKDQSILIEGEEYLTSKNFEEQQVQKIEILLAELSFPIELLSEEKSTNFYTERYTPPLIEQDIILVVQSFLL